MVDPSKKKRRNTSQSVRVTAKRTSWRITKTRTEKTAIRNRKINTRMGRGNKGIKKKVNSATFS